MGRTRNGGTATDTSEKKRGSARFGGADDDSKFEIGVDISNGSLNENQRITGPKKDVISTNLATPVHGQIESQLQSELNSNLTSHASDDVQGNDGDGQEIDEDDVLDDATNIDDELKTLEHISLNHIAKTAVSLGGEVVNTDHPGIEEDECIESFVDGSAQGVVESTNVQRILRQQSSFQSKRNTVIERRASTVTSDELASSIEKNSSVCNILRDKIFYFPVDSEENQHIISLIELMGGKVSNTYGTTIITLIPSADKYVDLNDGKYQYIYDFIRDTYRKKQFQNINNYRLSGRVKPKSNQDDSKSKKRTLKNPGEPDIQINIDENSEYFQSFLNKSDPEENERNKIKIKNSLIISGPKNKLDNGANQVTHGNILLSKNGDDIIRTNQVITEKRKPTKFTPQEDDFILDLVRRNPHLRSTHTFFARIAELPMLSTHTGNSIRYRFRKILSNRLEFVYKIDTDTGKPVLDPKTNEPVRCTEIPSLLKSQYTAEEDYTLCKHILSFKMGEMVVGNNKRAESQIPEVIFQQLNNINSRHSAMSWRDRYRKFAAKYGLKKYIEYYESLTEKGLVPSPMKNMSSRTDRKDFKVDVFGQEDSHKIDRPNKRAKTDKAKAKKVDVEMHADDEIGISIHQEIANSISSDMKISSSQLEKHETKEKDGFTSAEIDLLNNNSNHEIGKLSSMQAKLYESENKGKRDPDLETANIFIDANDDEIKEYNISLNEEHQELEISSKATKDSSGKDSSADHNDETDVDENTDVELIEVRGDDNGLMDFRQLLEIDPEPLKNRNNIDLESMTSSIHECFRNFGESNTPYELFKDISDQTGISMLWLNYWFDCSCGMLGTFVQAILHYLESGSLTMNNAPGFWTEKDDDLLKRDPSNKKLVELHGEVSVAKRKTVLFRYT